MEEAWRAAGFHNDGGATIWSMETPPYHPQYVGKRLAVLTLPLNPHKR